MKISVNFTVSVLFILVTGFFVSCTKSSNTSTNLYGKWEERNVNSGLSGKDSTLVAGNGNIYQFNSDSTYNQYTEGKLVESGSYHIVKTQQSGSNFEGTLFYSGQVDSGMAIALTGSTLILGTSAADGVTITLAKIY